MRTLAIDCATEACSVALIEDGHVLASRHEVLGRGHAERLVPMIAELPDRGRADRIAVSRGPGSFTGVRIGIAAARALALAWDARLVGYPTLALVAAMARGGSASPAEPLTVAMTGGHGQWFVEPFDREGASAAPLASVTPEEAIAAITTSAVAGSAAEALVERRGFGTAHALLPEAASFPLLPDAAFDTEVTAIYGRPPDARPAAAR